VIKAGIMRNAVEFNSLSDIKGYAVGAAGGGVLTSRVMKRQGDAGYTVNSYNSGAEVIAALDKGDIAAAIFVGAAPLPNIASLDKTKYKLIPVGEAIASRVKGVYRPATINYSGLTSSPVQTIAPMAVILTRKYSTPKKVAAQRHFRDCLAKNLPELKDNHSPNWQQVEANDHGVLDWYEIPTVNATTTK
jgi:TRAP-type uncharacterized transport system substrate-binding protein